MDKATGNPFGAGCAYIKGEIVPIAEAAIPITDVGFLHSDCTYDVVSVWEGSFFRLEEHLDRFEMGCKALHMKPHGLSIDDIKEILKKIVKTSGIQNAYVSFICTRGTASRVATRDPRLYVNHFYAFCVPYVYICPDMVKGLHVMIARDTIRIPADAVDPTVKNFHWGDFIRGLYEAYDRGGESVVLCDAEGNLTEGPGFNLFCVSPQGQLYTPAKGALEGITRQTILDLAQDLGIEAHKTLFQADFLKEAGEVFLTSTAGGVMPVTKLDDQVVGDGTMGPITRRLYDAYWEEHKEEGKWSTKVDYDN
jgi:branched-chain amino acid aminotransferase